MACSHRHFQIGSWVPHEIAMMSISHPNESSDPPTEPLGIPVVERFEGPASPYSVANAIDESDSAVVIELESHDQRRPPRYVNGEVQQRWVGRPWSNAQFNGVV